MKLKKKLFEIFGPVVCAAVILIAILVSPFNFRSFNSKTIREAAVSQSTNIYNQIVQQAQHITELRCQKLYDWYDSITTQDSLSLWLKEYNNLVREVNQQVDSILKQNISPSAPEYHLYKTSLNKLTENIWIDYFYKNQNKLLTSPPALKIHNE